MILKTKIQKLLVSAAAILSSSIAFTHSTKNLQLKEDLDFLMKQGVVILADNSISSLSQPSKPSCSSSCGLR
jgi:hypothetical protein